MAPDNMLESYRVTNFKNIADSVEEGSHPLKFARMTLLILPIRLEQVALR